ncbi:Uma2 family endonuclease [Hymenobacter luteus]|uniref:Uma2 family endonuclease n=2 Tax=Hymenobacter TaxID=89966 RepID=A0A7W9T4N9_9BACT|nr:MULTISPECIES: Uma2 family endonuclease [Hymenobacter]MBB4602857.1 Uma2 family endonuclease [Hymenobacter latericoloratus]MBB6060749.1 Uma2 family endonuclease [Hymenobacter luteus]
MALITQLSQLDLTRRYTYADYATWQLSEWVELIRGRVRLMSPAPKRQHQDITRNIEFPIMQFLRGKSCKMYHAPFDVRLTRATPNGDASIETVVQPDICVICDPQKLDERGCLGAPDWIIEILSPGNVSRDTKEKFDLYEEVGVREYWIVTPEQKNVVVYLLNEEGRYELRGEFYTPGLIPVATLPELQIEWAEVFEGV